MSGAAVFSRFLMFLSKDNPLAVFVARGLGAGAVLLVNLAVLFFESSDVAGLFFVTYTLFQIGAIASRYGAEIFIVREYYSPSGRWFDELCLSVRLALFVGVLVCPVFVFVGSEISDSWSGVSTVVGGGYWFVFILLWIPVMASSSLIYYVYQARHRVLLQVFGINVFQPWLFLIIYSALSVSFSGDSALEGGQVISIAFSLSVALYACASCVLMRGEGVRLYCVFNKSGVVEGLCSRAKYSLTTSATQLVGWLPYLLSSYLLGASFAAVFGLVQRFAMLSVFLSGAINSISMARYAQYISENKFSLVVREYWKSFFVLLVASSVFAGVSCVAFALIDFIPDEFVVAAYVVLAAYWFNCSTSVCGYYFQIVGAVSWLNYVLLFVVATTPFVTIYLLDEFGAVGAAFSIFYAVCCANIMLMPLSVFHMARETSKNVNF